MFDVVATTLTNVLTSNGYAPVDATGRRSAAASRALRRRCRRWRPAAAARAAAARPPIAPRGRDRAPSTATWLPDAKPAGKEKKLLTRVQLMENNFCSPNTLRQLSTARIVTTEDIWWVVTVKSSKNNSEISF